MSIGNRLRYAREQVGLTLAQVQEKTGVGESSLSEFENDKREPKLSQLHALAKAYYRSVSFFLSDEDALPQEVVLWRRVNHEDPPAKEIEGEFLRLSNQFHNLEIWCDEKTRDDLPYFRGNPEEFDYPLALALAKRVRDTLQLGDQPGHSLLHVLENEYGVKIFHLEFEPSGTSASVRDITIGSAILLNTLNNSRRRTFDLAHELFHLLTWDMFHREGHELITEEYKQEESYANVFAANLLVSEEALNSVLIYYLKDSILSFEGLYDMARLFNVSVDCIMWRIRWVKGLSKEFTEKIIEDVAELASTMYEKQVPPKWPERYHSLALKALRQGKISIGRFAEYMGISRREAMKYVEQEVENGKDFELTPA